MRSGKITVYLLTLGFLLLAAFLWVTAPRTEPDPVALVLTSAGEEQAITCWKNEAGEYYLFLPSYTDLASAKLRCYAEDVRIDGRPVSNGMSCEELAADTSYGFSFLSEDGEVHTQLTITQSADLPALYIDTGSGNMDHIHGKKGNMETGRMRLYLPDGELSCAGELEEIKGRGNDWLIPKKSYSLRLVSGMDLLGMGQAEKWILQANAFDASNLRNKLVYDFAGTAGLAYSPESRWVDLYLNGEYAGLYLLCERNELHARRVALEGENAYLVSMDVGWRLEQNGKRFLTTEAGYAFRIHDSLLGDSSLQQLLQSVENAICSEDGRDPLTGKHWEELIDLDSWVRKYLIEEIFGNSDGGAISQYFYGSLGETPMYAGPVWDFDISMGNGESSRVREPGSILAARRRTWSRNDNLSWYYGLSGQAAFRERMTEVYRDEFKPLLDTFLKEKPEEYAAVIAAGSEMNRIRWGSPWDDQVAPAVEIQEICSYLEARITFLDQLWLEQLPFCRVLVDADDGGFTACFAVRPGEQLPDLSEYTASAESLGWYRAGSGEAFDITQPIWEDTEIILRKARQEPVESGDVLSVQFAPFALLTGFLVILWFIDRGRRRQNRQDG